MKSKVFELAIEVAIIIIKSEKAREIAKKAIEIIIKSQKPHVYR